MLGKLRSAKKILDDAKITFWLDCGTLLFVIREHRMDKTDTDFSIHKEDTDKLLLALPKFEEAGFQMRRMYVHPKYGLVEISFRNEGFGLDIFVRQRVDKFVVGITRYERGFVAWGQPAKFFKKLRKKDFDGRRYNIPDDVEGYLAYFFGADWRTPKPNWDSSEDAPCINERFL